MLARRRKNNPLFVGDAGVGKTAIVEGLARRIELGEAPPGAAGRDDLRARHGLAGGGHALPRRLRGALQGGDRRRWRSRPNAIVFIDELHTIVGAGAASGGAMDASNLIKPALATGKLRCIGTTTHKEYRSYIEKDRALARRFQPIEVDEPSIEDTIKVLEGLRPTLRGVPRRHLQRRGDAGGRRAVGALPQRPPACPTRRSTSSTRRAPRPSSRRAPSNAGTATSATPRRVNAKDIETVVATMARIPPRRVAADDRERLQNLEAELQRQDLRPGRGGRAASRRRSR